jgi:hypothetical protein
LKNIYTGNDKTPKVVPYLGTGEKAIAEFAKMYDNGELKRLTVEELTESLFNEMCSFIDFKSLISKSMTWHTSIL